MTDQVGYSTSEDRTMPAICYGLYLLAFATGITAIVGVIIAYAQRSTAGPDMHSHYTFLIRTFWLTIWWVVIGAGLTVVGGILSLVLVGLPILGVGLLILSLFSLWFIARCCLGAYYLAKDEAYPRPMSWLF